MTRLARRILLTTPLVLLLTAAGPWLEPPVPLFQTAAGSCAHAAAVASRQGGEVIGAPQLVKQGGREVCVVTVLIRRPGSPPVRQRITIPAR